MKTFRCMVLAAAVASAVAAAIPARGATPAATQSWVKNYVSTNSMNVVVMSNAVDAASIRMSTAMARAIEILVTDTSTNAVEKAADAMVSEAYPIIQGALERSIQ